MICVLFLLETWNADRLMPNPASPVVWSLLGLASVVSAVLALWWAAKAKHDR